EEGHEVHIIYVTDNRVLISWGLKANELIVEEINDYKNLNEDQIADIAVKEAKDAASALGFSPDSVHLLKIHDQDAINKIDLAVSLSKEIIKDADKIVLPGDIRSHPDHKATHIIAKTAGKELSLDSEYLVYYSVSPKEKQIKVNIAKYREKLYDIMKIYKTQLCIKGTRAGWETLRRKRTERFGVYRLKDMGKYDNF
ncbi:MAG: PIG-L deacetylase family protein, partial [Promethearchaeota archaeon]